VPVNQIASVVAEGELHHDRRQENCDHLPAEGSRSASRPGAIHQPGALANIDFITRAPLAGGTYMLKLRNGEQLDVSRIQSRLLKGRLLRIERNRMGSEVAHAPPTHDLRPPCARPAQPST
jgi:hypothetical protein